MATPFLAEIRIFGFNFAPTGWAFCNGQIMPIAQNTALFSLIGTFYGGNGTTNFGLPNLQASTPLSTGQGPGLTPRDLGESGGVSTVTLLQSEMPAHTHMAVASGAAGRADRANAFNNLLANPADATYANAGANAIMNGSMVGVSGGNLPHNNMQPYLTLNFCIALSGVYPSRP